LKVELTLVLALRDLVSPHADASFSVVGEAGRALVAAGFTVPAVPEDVALGLVGEDAVETRAVFCADGGLCKHVRFIYQIKRGTVKVVGGTRERLSNRRRKHDKWSNKRAIKFVLYAALKVLITLAMTREFATAFSLHHLLYLFIFIVWMSE